MLFGSQNIVQDVYWTNLSLERIETDEDFLILGCFVCILAGTVKYNRSIYIVKKMSSIFS